MAGESQLSAFAAPLGRVTHGGDPRDRARAWDDSARPPGAFWRHCLQACQLLTEGADEPALSADGQRWFPDLRLNYAENLLSSHVAPDDAIALTASSALHGTRHLTRGELRTQVERLARALTLRGLLPGDRVVMVPRSDATAVVATLAVAAVGASVSLASPEMAAGLMAARFERVAPRMLLAHTGAMAHDTGMPLGTRVAQLAAALPTLELLVLLDDASSQLPPTEVPALDLSALVADVPDDGPYDWPRHPFDQPLFITAAFGAGGEPEALVHGAGGVLLEHLKEQRQQCGITPADVVFGPTSVASSMWVWQLSALATGAGIALYDGPMRDAATLWRVAWETQATVFVASAPYLKLGAHAGMAPAKAFDLQRLRHLLCTGVTLDAATQAWLRQALPGVTLQAMCVSPDMMGCLLISKPGQPMDDLASASLGLQVEQAPRDDGAGAELVVRNAFPSRPLGYVADTDGARYAARHLQPDGWHSGERVELAELVDGGALRVLGPADGVMSVRGTRVGAAEVVGALRGFDEIREAMVVEQPLHSTLAEGRAVLLLALEPGKSLDGGLVARIRRQLAEAASASHVPDVVLAVPELPRTPDGRLSEAAMRDAVCGRPLRRGVLLRNPGCLDVVRESAVLRNPDLALGPLPPPPAPGWRSRQDHEAYLRSLWERLFGFAPIGLDDDFFELGGHSLLAARMFAEIQRLTQQDFAPSTLLRAPTIRQLARVMDAAAWDLPVPLVQLRAGQGKPFFLMHSLAGNFLEMWAVLRALDTPRPVYGLQAKGLGPDQQPHMSVVDMAREYIGHMKLVQPQGPYSIGGYSLGGLIAYEMAQQLRRAGDSVELLTLIDTHVHGRYLPLPEWLRYCGGWLRLNWRRLQSMPFEQRVDYVRKKGYVLADRARTAVGQKPKRPELVGDLQREANFPPALRRLRGAMLVALRGYRPEPYPGRVVFLRAAIPTAGDPLPLWRKMVRGGLEVSVTPGDHDEMINGANAKALALALARHL